MKKLLTALLIVFILGATFAGCAMSGGDWDYIEKRGKIILGFDPHFPPMGFYENSSETNPANAVGFDIDLAREVAAVLGVELEFVGIKWSTKEKELKSRNVDLIWNGYTINDQRASNHLFSVPYMKNDQTIMVLKENQDKYTSIESLKTGKMAYQENSSAEAVIANHPELSQTAAIAVENYGLALTELESNNVDFIVMDVVAAIHHAKANPDKYHVIKSLVLGTENYGIGMRKNASLTLHKINSALFELRDNGKLLEIATKWGLQEYLFL